MDTKIDLPIYSGKMDPKEVMDWIDALTSFFDYEEIPEHQKVKIAKSKLKGSALNWWNFTQAERVKMDKNQISTWKKMVTLVKEAYVLEDYEILLHKKRQSVRQKKMDVLSYTEEFHQLRFGGTRVT